MSIDETRIQELSTALKSERQARQRAETELISVQKEQQEFISLVAHELRIPMTAIQGYTDLLIKAIMGPVNDTQLTFLKTIRANVERMSRLVSDLSDINKIAAGNIKIKLEPVELNPLIDELTADYKLMTTDKTLSLNLDISKTLPRVICDVDRLQQVLRNLLRNAVQYTPGGGKISICAAVNPESNRMQVQVTDTGIGIPPNQQDRVFEMFFRSSDDDTRQTSGNGLALHLSKLLLELQDGTISFISTRGEGSKFTITLPLAPS